MSERQIFGFFNINKPTGLTSHDVVARVRRLLRPTAGKVKVGHAGTLDPLASGVLVLCLGPATRLSEYVMQSQKHYRAIVRPGVVTDTYDAEGRVLAQQDASHITREQVEAALPAFTGPLMQLPPMYSAIKQDGHKLYELARAGQTVERQPRQVQIYSLHLAEWSPPLFTLEIVCSPGTYIRSLAHDLGQALDVGASLDGLVRTASGAFTLAQAITLDALEGDDWHSHIIPPRTAFAGWPAVQLNTAQATDLSSGRPIQRDETAGEWAMAYLPDGHLLAVLRAEGPHWKPHKVFLPQS